MSLELVPVMSEVADVLDGHGGLRAFAFPAESAPVPFALCGFTDDTDFRLTFGAAANRLTLPVAVAVGKVRDRSAWSMLGSFGSPAGALSLRALFDAYTEPAAFSVATVTGVEYGTLTMGDIEYLSGTFALDIVG